MPITPATSIAPLKPLAVPMIPNGPTVLILHSVIAATMIRATPITTRIFIISILEIILAPITEPMIAEPIMSTSVKGSTSIFVMVIVASTQIGTPNATFNVPGIRSSGIALLNFQADVAMA